MYGSLIPRAEEEQVSVASHAASETTAGFYFGVYCDLCSSASVPSYFVFREGDRCVL